jgi:predicted permease
MTTLVDDLRQAWRQVRRQPGVAIAIVATLTLALGVNTALFSILRAVVFGAVPVHDPDTLAAVYTIDRKNPGHMPVSDMTAFDVREALGDEVPLTLFAVRSVSVATPSGRTQVTAILATANYFDVVGVTPALGTGFRATEDVGPVVEEVVVSHAFWRQKLGGDPDVIGRPLVVEGVPLTIVGVGPEGFAGTNLFDAAVFVPYASHTTVFPEVPWFGMRRFLAFEVLARLPESVPFDRFEARIAEIADRIAAANPDEIGTRRLHAVPFAHAILGPDQRATVVLAATLGGTIVGFVLLVACANAANLLLARASTRHGELALRGVLGATPWRLLRQALLEALLLAGCAGLLSLAIAPVLRDGLWLLRPPLLEMASLRPAIDARVLGFTAAATVATGLIFGAAPALRAVRVDVTSPLRHHTTAGAASHRQMRSGLVIVQVALSFVALLAAGLLSRSVMNATAVDPGFAVDELTAFDLRATPTVAAQITDELSRMPSIDAAAASTQLPFGHNEFRRTIAVDTPSRTDAPSGLLVRTASVDPGWRAAMGIARLAGRDFDRDDDSGHPMVALVNDTFATVYWDGGWPVGQRIRFAGVRDPVEIVGVVATTKTGSVTESPQPFVYLPLGQWPHQGDLQLVVRASNSDTAIATVMSALEQRDDATVSRARTFAEDRDAALGPMRSAAVLLLLFGALAVALATSGIHAVMTYAVRQRTREIGIRMALGAQPHHVHRQLLGETAGLVLVGNGLGVAGGLVLQHALADHLFAVPLGDAITFGGVALVVTAAALIAAWCPARAATRIDPARAIHHG